MVFTFFKQLVTYSRHYVFRSLGRLSLYVPVCDVLVWLCKQWTLFPIPICYSVQKTKGTGAVQHVSIFHELCWTSIFSLLSQLLMCLSQGFYYFCLELCWSRAFQVKTFWQCIYRELEKSKKDTNVNKKRISMQRGYDYVNHLLCTPFIHKM